MMNRHLLRLAALAACTAMLVGASAAPAARSDSDKRQTVRFATFNA